MFKVLLFISLSILVGCKTSETTNRRRLGEDKLVSAYYDSETNEYRWDQWDFYIDAIKKGRIIFEFPTAAFIYLISNVKIFDSRPEVNDIDYWDRVTVIIIIFRWSW